MGAIPDAVLDEIKRRTDLAALISEHVALKRSGRGFLGLCPFHQEKTPSFHVDPERGFFHCFGCNAGGNAFTFLMRVTGATFPEAVRTLAARAGVAVPETRASGVHDRLAEVNGLAAQLFTIILRESRLGAPGREYMARRGIDAETAQRFNLGFAPATGWVEKLLKREVTPQELKTLGLASPSRIGHGMYPQFRDRLMFPIHDLSGRVIAFGGRAVGEVKGPKYLNSPETPLYRKGHHLYGLDLARDAIRAEGRIVLVEGYLDAIALAQAGIQNVAAVLGTALTVDQLKLARRFAEDIVICFDGDEAGRRAALRAFPLCVDQVDLWPRAVFLPAGDDPDSLVRKVGRAAFAERIAAATTLFDFYLDELVGRDAGVGETARAASRMAALLGSVQDPIVRDKIVRGVAGRLGVSDAALLEAAQRSRQAEQARAGGAASSRPGKRPAGARPGAAASGVAAPQRQVQRGGAARRAHFSTEAELVELVLCDAGVAARAAEQQVWREFADAELSRLAEMIVARRAAGGPFEASELLSELPRGMAERVARRLASSSESELQRAGDEWFARRAERIARAERLALIAQLRAAEHRRDAAQVAATLEALRRGHETAEEQGEAHDEAAEPADAASGGGETRSAADDWHRPAERGSGHEPEAEVDLEDDLAHDPDVEP
jgi:DNA primase